MNEKAKQDRLKACEGWQMSPANATLEEQNAALKKYMRTGECDWHAPDDLPLVPEPGGFWSTIGKFLRR